MVLLSAELYRCVAHHGEFWDTYGSARGVIVIILVNILIFFHPCLAAADSQEIWFTSTNITNGI